MIVKINSNERKSLLEGYSIHIPRAYAREETKEKPDDPSEVENYELFIDKQMGSSATPRPTNIYWKLPKSGKYIVIELYRDGGLDYKPGPEHSFALRETDELDRRIVFGFCKKYRSTLISACHSRYRDNDLGIINAARYYKASDMPKRIKIGKGKDDLSWFYKYSVQPYEEIGIFSECQFI